MVLLDTCALIWLVEDLDCLSAEAKATISQNGEDLHISAISALEISLLAVKKRILLPEDPFKWYSDALRLHGVREVAVNGAVAYESGKLPLIHKDPCDRIIIATAIKHKATVVTKDSVFRNYKIHVVW